MDNKQKEVFQMRMTEAHRARLRFIAWDRDKPESEVLRELINEETEQTMFAVAVKASIPGACLQLKLPAAAQSMSYDDIVAMLDEKRGSEFSKLVMARSSALVKQYRLSLGYS